MSQVFSVTAVIHFSRHAVDCAGKVREILHEDFSCHIPIQKLARKVGLNPRTLHDCFKHLYGKSIFEYGQDLRLQHGRKLLEETDWIIQDIAEKCGYAEQSNFGAAFKKKYGVVPGQWRKGMIRKCSNSILNF
jgi:AraC-like DNA-binding protein